MGLSKAEMVVLIAEDCLGWPYVYGERGAYCTAAVRRNRANALDAGMPAEAKVIRNTCQVLKGSKADCTGCRYYPGGTKVRCFDCRGFTYWVLQQVGITISGSGATSQWNTDANWKAKGLIPGMLAGLVGFIKVQMNQNRAMKQAVKAILQDRLLQGYKHYLEKGWADLDDRKNLENVWAQYHALGGNGDMNDLRYTFKHLPMTPGGTPVVPADEEN